MSEYDVVVVGAGPAGSSAAKAAAERRAKTVLLEEHTVIGVPTYCSGGLYSALRPDVTQEIVRALGKRIVLREFREAHVFAPSGKLVKKIALSGRDCYIVERAQLDRELVRQAVNAGADLLLNTRVTGLLKEAGRVIGVSTSSTTMPNVFGDVVIAADGLRGGLKGVAKWEGLIRRGQTSVGGITLELTRVKGFEPDVVEFHAGSFTPRGFTTVWPVDAVSCITHFPTLADFQKLKGGNYLLSKKLKDAVPLRITGYSSTSDLGLRFPEIVKDGLILTGSAANWRGIIPAIVFGLHAGEVAAEAKQEGDFTMKNLSKYVDLCEKSGFKGIGFQFRGHDTTFPFYQRSDQEIEKLLVEMIERDEFPWMNTRT